MGSLKIRVDCRTEGPLSNGDADKAAQEWAQNTTQALADKGVVWSPWLEGTSKRNDSTGFKGYGLFRKTRLQLQKLAPQIAQEQLDKVISRMGGE